MQGADTERKDVWIPDKERGYVPGTVLKENGDECLCSTQSGHSVTVASAALSPMNPRKFDKAADMADLTFRNEASVVHNLQQRYLSDMIYVRLSAADVAYRRPTPASSSWR